jgi:SAM-dependent methyltransferase
MPAAPAGEWGTRMGDYTPMSGYYDLIMTSGYYDYDAIVDELARAERVGTVLEIGAGTGLILDRLAARRPELRIAGIDLTQAMLDIAAERLARHPRVTLHQQDVVTLRLGREFDLAFSYGGVWYFVPAGDGFMMISHLRDDRANLEGLERLAEHLVAGGTLLLGVQGPHHDYSSPVSNGMVYSQRITPIDGGFRKDYQLADGDEVVMAQTTDYRIYRFDHALELLDKAGFDHQPRVAEGTPLFLEFTRR